MERLMKKVWQIYGTTEFHSNKEELKKVRRSLNKDAGIDETDKEIDPNKWKYKIVKGPEHPGR